MAGQLSWQMLMLPPLVSSNHSPQPNTLQDVEELMKKLQRRSTFFSSEHMTSTLQEQRTESHFLLQFEMKMSETCPQFLFWCRVMELQLFSRLYIACKNRDGNLEEFFRHENQPWPPSLADRGQMRKGQKADLVQYLEALQSNRPEEAPNVESIVIDGAVAVQMLNRRTARTFQEYSDTVFMPYKTKQLERTKRVDIVWDIYKDDSLKAGTREKRGKGTRRRV